MGDPARAAALGVGLCLVAACGGDDPAGADAATGDAGAIVADAGAADAEASSCVLLEPRYSGLPPATGEALVRPVDDEDPTGPQYVTLQIPLNADARPDVLFIELWGDSDPFMSGFVTGSFTIVDEHADLFTCGYCVYIAADYQAGQPIDFHMASSGSLTIDEVDTTAGSGRIRGSLTDVRMRAVTVDEDGQHPVEMGCVTTVESLAVDFTIPAAAP